jgi:UDP-N-acetylglucosamine 2-epimerase (non-hydrolysing)
VPCLTLRDSTERPITTELGTSRLVGHNAQAIRKAFDEAIGGRWRPAQEIPMWDGHAATRIATELASWLRASAQPAARPV